ncbi:MAG: hypothetical protein ACP5LW_03225 [Nitrososphaeria archaeon]
MMCEDLGANLRLMRMLGRLGSIKAEFAADRPDFKFDYININGPKKGEIVDVGLWLAPALAERGLIKVDTEEFEVEVFNALNKEKMLGAFQLGPLPQDFYQKFSLYVKLKKDDQRIKMYVYDLIKIRINKIVQMAVQGVEPEKLSSLLTQEEIMLYRKIKSEIEGWYSNVISEG